MVSPALTRSAASSRTPGFDVARALAILGMVLVNYRAMAGPEDLGPAWLVWGIDLLEGKAAALFVTLAGLGVTLRARSARARNISIGEERRALLRRAAVLFALGLIHLHMWEWDILHCYGVYLILAAYLLDAKGAILLCVGVLVTVIGAQMQAAFNYDHVYDFWARGGAVANIAFNGLFPVFPWFAFVVLGIWLGRQDLRDPSVRLRLALVFATVGILAETVSPFAMAKVEAHGASFTYWSWLSAWPRAPGPMFVVSGSAFAILTIVTCIHVTEKRVDRLWVLALTATGQLALTIYVAHAAAILMPLQHEWFADHQLVPIVVYALSFYLVAVWFALSWRRQHRYGPLELIVRQLAARRRPGPWGGATMRALAEGDGSPGGPAASRPPR